MQVKDSEGDEYGSDVFEWFENESVASVKSAKKKTTKTPTPVKPQPAYMQATWKR